MSGPYVKVCNAAGLEAARERNKARLAAGEINGKVFLENANEIDRNERELRPSGSSGAFTTLLGVALVVALALGVLWGFIALVKFFWLHS